MGVRYGGETPENFGLRITVETPAGTTSAAPVTPGQMFKLGPTDVDGGAYKCVALVDNDDMSSVVLVQAAQRSETVGPITVNVLGFYSQIRRLPYLTGSAPSLGQSVQASATVKKVDGKAFAAGCGFVLFVDTVTEEVEVLC
jgi:hypothetical protein